MSNNKVYAIMTERKTSSDLETGKPDLELRILDSKRDLKEIKRNTDKKQRKYEHGVETTKNPQDIVHGFINYLEENKMYDCINNTCIISDDKKNCLVFPNNKYEDMGREITWYLEMLQEQN